MKLRAHVLVFATLAFSALTFGQYAEDDPTQVYYFSNFGPLPGGILGDATINIVNTGASGGDINVDFYVFAPDEQLISCCSCLLTANGLGTSISVINEILDNTLTPALPPTSLTVKLVATNSSGLATGMRAWGTGLHAAPTTPATYQVTESPFLAANIGGTSELANDVKYCNFIKYNGSGFGICNPTGDIQGHCKGSQ